MEEKKGLIFKKWPWNSLLRDNHGFSNFSSCAAHKRQKRAKFNRLQKVKNSHLKITKKSLKIQRTRNSRWTKKNGDFNASSYYDFRDFFQTINLQSDLGFVQGKNRSLYFSYLYWHANPYVMELIPIYGYITCRWSTFAPDIRLMFLFYSHFRRAPN